MSNFDLLLISAQHPQYPHTCHICGEYACDASAFAATTAPMCSVAALIVEVERLREALAELVDAIDLAGGRQRYWPRDMRLDGTARLVDLALDKALAALPPQEAHEDG